VEVAAGAEPAASMPVAPPAAAAMPEVAPDLVDFLDDGGSLRHVLFVPSTLHDIQASCKADLAVHLRLFIDFSLTDSHLHCFSPPPSLPPSLPSYLSLSLSLSLSVSVSVSVSLSRSRRRT
jgi:hypothetical protein